MASVDAQVQADAVPADEAVEQRPRGRFHSDASRRRWLALADVTALSLSGAAIAVIRPEGDLWVMFAFLPGWLGCAKVCGLYDLDHRTIRHLTIDEFPRILLWALLGTSLLTLASVSLGLPTLLPASRVRLWMVLTVVAFLCRALARVLWRAATSPERVVVVGSGDLPDAVLRKFELFSDIHVEVVARLDAIPDDLLDEGHAQWLEGADRIVLASSSLSEALIVRLLPFCRLHQLKLSVVPPIRAMLGTAVELGHIADLPLIEYHTWDPSRTSMLAKRALDLVVSVVGLVLLSPLFLLIALLIRITCGRGVFFFQGRAGKGGRPYRMAKFRTMTRDAESRRGDLVDLDFLPQPMYKLDDDPRVTGVGRFLRRWSLDELPQLWNVLRGEMSLVGPRPEEVTLVRRYAPEHLFRLSVKPGMTGPMQIYGRGALSFEERLAVEREYVEHYSLVRDARILALTIAAVLRRRGAY